MGIARDGSGAIAALGALDSQVHPVSALPPVAASWFGCALAGPELSTMLPIRGASLFLAMLFVAVGLRPFGRRRSHQRLARFGVLGGTPGRDDRFPEERSGRPPNRVGR